MGPVAEGEGGYVKIGERDGEVNFADNRLTVE